MSFGELSGNVIITYTICFGYARRFVPVAKAKAAKKYKGRKPTARAKADDVIRLDAEGLQRTEIARRLDIGVASVYRVLADTKKDAGTERVAA
jgi:DNA invertase Pin-like site-specific DNA recombinase